MALMPNRRYGNTTVYRRGSALRGAQTKQPRGCVTRPLDRFVPSLVLVEPNLAIEFYSPLVPGPRPEVAADAAGDLGGTEKVS